MTARTTLAGGIAASTLGEHRELRINLSFAAHFFGGHCRPAAAVMGTRLVRAELAAEKKTVGVAIVGIGKLTLGQLLPAFADAKVAKLVAFVSGHPDKAREQADKFSVDRKNIYNYENFDSIKDNPAIDVVYIVLPNSMHAEYSIRAAKAGSF